MNPPTPTLDTSGIEARVEFFAQAARTSAAAGLPGRTPSGLPGLLSPAPEDVNALRDLLDLLEGNSAETRARFILSSNWLRDRGAAAATRIQRDLRTLRHREYRRTASTPGGTA